ncbi:MAG: hypothetical protein WD602_08180 [Actinomycetota bacterium]
MPTLQLIAVVVLLGSAGLSQIGSNSHTEGSDPPPAIAVAEPELCESIDQCVEASSPDEPDPAASPVRTPGACPPRGDETTATGADELQVPHDPIAVHDESSNGDDTGCTVDPLSP